jgi:PAS domain S-box-containing protein
MKKQLVKELSKRLKLEKMLTEISSKALASFGASEFQKECLAIMGTTLDVSRACIFEHHHQTATMDNAFAWAAGDIEPQKHILQGIAADAVPWWTDQMKCNKIICFENIEHIPSEPEKALLRKQQIKSILVVPLFVSKKYHGFLGFDECRSHRRFRDKDIAIFQAATQIVAGFLERIQLEKAFFNERRQREQALAESECKYRQLFEMESDAIFLIDNENGRLLEINSACESLYGYSRDQLLQMKNTDLSAEPRETRKATLGALSSVPLRYHRKKDGTVFPVEISARHFVWQGREVHVAAIRDITPRIEAEQQKDELEAQLRQAQKMESIGTLAGGIAHDFNNILSAITGYTELAMLDTTGSSNSSRHLQQVLNASQRAKNLVAQILTFSRQAKAEFGPVQIRMIVKETVKMLRATFPASIMIDTDVVTDGMVMGDANQIHQVVMNLCANAYHAMKASGGCLRVDLAEINMDEDHAQIQDLSPGRYMQLTVADTGVGMDKTTMRRVFEPYFTTKEKGEGTGLGLSMVYGIIKAHKGAVTVESELAKGTSFSVYLPKIESRTDTQPAQNKILVSRGHEKVLCVDDEPELVNMIKAMLRKLGYQVTTRSSSLEALELFKQNSDRFDVVITDLNMPHLSGERLARQMVEIRPDLPIILCTGFSDQLTDQDLAAAGIRAVALKPVLRADLAKLIREVLDGVRSS